MLGDFTLKNTKLGRKIYISLKIDKVKMKFAVRYIITAKPVGSCAAWRPSLNQKSAERKRDRERKGTKERQKRGDKERVRRKEKKERNARGKDVLIRPKIKNCCVALS